MASGKAVRPGPGSYRLLAWVARLGMSGIEPAQLALGISQAAMYSHVARLSREGLLWRVRVGDGHGGVVAGPCFSRRSSPALATRAGTSASTPTTTTTTTRTAQVSHGGVIDGARQLLLLPPCSSGAEG
jgi:hypothetical protein